MNTAMLGCDTGPAGSTARMAWKGSRGGTAAPRLGGELCRRRFRGPVLRLGIGEAATVPVQPAGLAKHDIANRQRVLGAEIRGQRAIGQGGVRQCGPT